MDVEPIDKFSIVRQEGQLEQGSKEVCPLSDTVEYDFRDYVEIEMPLLLLIVNQAVRSSKHSRSSQTAQ